MEPSAVLCCPAVHKSLLLRKIKPLKFKSKIIDLFKTLFPSKWKLVTYENTQKQLLAIRDLLPQFDTVVNGGDADREGQLLVDENFEFLSLQRETASYFHHGKGRYIDASCF